MDDFQSPCFTGYALKTHNVLKHMCNFSPFRKIVSLFTVRLASNQEKTRQQAIQMDFNVCLFRLSSEADLLLLGNYDQMQHLPTLPHPHSLHYPIPFEARTHRSGLHRPGTFLLKLQLYVKSNTKRCSSAGFTMPRFEDPYIRFMNNDILIYPDAIG